MAESTQPTGALEVSLPEAGETVEYRFSPDVPVKFTFFVSEVLCSSQGADLVMTAENGGVIVIKDYQTMADQGALPVFELNGGEEVPGDIYLFAFSGAGLDIETAAGTEEEMAGGAMEEGEFEITSPGNVLDADVPADAQGHSSLAVPAAEEPLVFSEVLSDDAPETALPGQKVACFEADHVLGSPADSHDAMADTIQHIIDSPDKC